MKPAANESVAGRDNPALIALRDRIIRLSTMAVEVRYPGMSADQADAEEALRTCRDLRESLRQLLQL